MKKLIFILFIPVLFNTPVFSEESRSKLTKASQDSFNNDLKYAQVIFVKATQYSKDIWKLETTVRHNDEGWEHYADSWQVVNPDNGKVIAERILAHPHDNEQPFTRSLNNIEIPVKLTEVIIRAKCNIHGFGGKEILVDLTVDQGDDFKVIRFHQ